MSTSNEPAPAYDGPFPHCSPARTMPGTGRSEDRRRAGRPRNGDTKPCPKCAAALCDFNARYRVPDAGAVPAWICDSPTCRYCELVRGTDKTQAGQLLIRGSRDVQASVKRLMMKARFLVHRSRTRLAWPANKSM
jgi:hypothetical protein